MKKIYLIGNPNSGKTTVFNSLTGKKNIVGNYIGTTLYMKQGESIQTDDIIYDLAGIYNFDEQKAEEKIAWKDIEKGMRGYQDEEIIFVQVINAGQWRQSLSLTLDLQKKGIHPILFFNTKKSDKSLGESFYSSLSQEFSLPIFYADAKNKNFPSVFWEKFSQSQLFFTKKKSFIPKTFSSLLEQNKYIDNFFSQFLSSPQKKNTLSQKFPLFLDSIFLHSFGGILIFLLIMYAIFEITFSLGSFPMDFIDFLIASLQDWLRTLISSTIFSSFLIDGVIAGVGGTLVFLPNILILFFFLSLLRETGYLARTTFLFSVFFQKIGLSSRASIPLLMGFGCNVPSILAIKSFETRKEQVLVAMMSLFMSCGARLPVYSLLIAAFIPKNIQGGTLFSLYLLGIGVSFLTGKILSIAYKRKEKQNLIAYEIPPLIFPSFCTAFSDAYQKAKLFILKAGKFIFPVSIILWGLFTFPFDSVEKNGVESSYGATIGKTFQPIFEPMQFDWKISTALLSGIAAKEVMVTTFASLYHSENNEESLQKNIKDSGVFTIPIALALLVFVLLYTPCMAVIGVIRSELGNFWAFFAILYPFIIAWIFSFLTFSLSRFILS